jgi:type I restriction enzyme, S subunit
MKFESEDIVFTPITSLLSDVIDNRGRTCPTAEIGIPLIATNCIGNENLYPVKKNIRHVSLETYNTWFRGHPEPGDVIFVNKGTPGRVCLVPEPIDFCIAQDMVSLRVNEHVNNLYLLAALRSSQVQNQIQQMQVGTMIPHFKKGDFEKLLIPMRDMPNQIAIGKIYFELSQKIDVNERTSKTLEDIAQTIFKSWFIDFDPVKAKMAGEKPAGMDAATAALFPDSFEKTELGLIPSGWKATKLSSSLKLCKSTVKAGPFTENVPYVPVDQIGARDIFLKNSMHGSEAKTSLVSFKKNDILFGAMRPYFHKVVLAPFDGTTRTTTFVLRAINPHYLSHSLFSVYQESAVAFATNNSQGTTIPYAVWNNSFEDLPIVLPPEPIAEAFNDIVLPMLEFGYSLIAQNRTLVEIRDGLLPRLISGDLQIPEEMLAS